MKMNIFFLFKFSDSRTECTNLRRREPFVMPPHAG